MTIRYFETFGKISPLPCQPVPLLGNHSSLRPALFVDFPIGAYPLPDIMMASRLNNRSAGALPVKPWSLNFNALCGRIRKSKILSS